VLEKGLLKRIGDGNSTSIWHDRWIPNHFDGRPLIVPDNPQVTTVSDLMTDSGGWNEELIKHQFVDVDAHAILCTPIRGAGEDFWSWELEVHGHYSVKSAYRHIYSKQWHQSDQRAASSSGDQTWKRIWQLCVPPKVRVFWWRVVNEFLPAKGILHRRHIEPIPNCDVCGSEEESIRHVLLDCTIARRFWEQTRALTGVKMTRLHPQTWAWDLINPSHCPERNAAIILCGMWSLWMGRNKRKHGEPENSDEEGC
jgi:hypothetical protein